MTPHNQELALLLARVADGDSRAFEALYRATSGPLYALLLRMLREPMQAEDLLQECYLKIWRNAASYRPDKGAVMAWLTALVRNAALDQLRSPRQALWNASEELVSEGPAELVDPQRDLVELADARQELNRVAECMRQLSGWERQTFLMAYYEGMSHQEISTRLRVPLGTVKSWIRRGLQKLRGELEHAAALARPSLPPLAAVQPALAQRPLLPVSSGSFGRDRPAVMTKRMASSKPMSSGVR